MRQNNFMNFELMRDSQQKIPERKQTYILSAQISQRLQDIEEQEKLTRIIKKREKDAQRDKMLQKNSDFYTSMEIANKYHRDW